MIQPKVFVLFAVAGMLTGVFYSLLRGIRGTTHRRVWTGLLDLLFCLIAVLLFGTCCAYTLEGEIRLFGVLAYLAGFAVFDAGPGRALSVTISSMIRCLSRTIKRMSDALNRMLAKHRADR